MPSYAPLAKFVKNNVPFVPLTQRGRPCQSCDMTNNLVLERFQSLTFGARLRWARESASPPISRREMADHLRCAVGTIRNYEAWGSIRPSGPAGTEIPWPSLVLWAELTKVPVELLAPETASDLREDDSRWIGLLSRQPPILAAA
jgi:hypothetical protein